jgi:chromosome segregation ATPase
MLEWLTSPSITAIVNVLSVLGFGVTICVMFAVRQIKNNYTSRIRVPELRIKLGEHISSIGELLNDYANNKNKIAPRMEQIESVLKAIKKRLARPAVVKIQEVLSLMRNLNNEQVTDEAVIREIYNKLHGVSAELEQWENDMKWSA